MNTDNIYYKQAFNHGPQAYVPYAPKAGMKPYGSAQMAAADECMMPLAIVGLCVTVILGLPIGVFTGPAALKRANKLEHLVKAGRRPMSDRSNISGARICAWISIAISIPLLLMWLGMMLLFAMAFAG